MRSLSFLVEGIYMINWNNLLKCLAFGILVPIPLLCLLALMGSCPAVVLVAQIVCGVVATSYALGKWDPFD